MKTPWGTSKSGLPVVICTTVSFDCEDCWVPIFEFAAACFQDWPWGHMPMFVGEAF